MRRDGENRKDSLARQFENPRYRRAYVNAHNRTILAAQLRALRGDLSQAQFGKKVGMTQTVISRLENERYGAMSLRTLLKIAERLDIAFLGRFVTHADFIKMTNLGPEDYHPESYS